MPGLTNPTRPCSIFQLAARLESESSNDSHTGLVSQLSTQSTSTSSSGAGCDGIDGAGAGAGAETPTQVSTKTLDEMMETTATPTTTPTPPQITADINNGNQSPNNSNFEKAGIHMIGDHISVDIASATGLRKTDFSTLYDERKRIGAANSSISVTSKIPRSPLPAIRSRRNSVENLTITETRAESPATTLSTVRKSPQYSSVRRSIQKPGTVVASTTTAASNAGKNTWNGRDAAQSSATKKRPALTRDTFSRNSPSRASYQGGAGSQYDSNGRRINGNASNSNSNGSSSSAKPKAASVNTSPSKQTTMSSPLAMQLLEAAESAKNDTQIIEKMKELLREYNTRESGPAIAEYEDFTTAWVNNNCLGDRTESPLKKKSSTASSTTTTESSNHSGQTTARRSMSKIPAPVTRQKSELY